VANYGSEEVTLTIYKRPEILFFQVQNLHPAMKMYLVSLISRLFEEIHYNPPQEKVLLGHQYLQQKLLSDSATFQPAEQNTFEGWDSEDTRKRVTEIIESINAENNSLVPLAYSHALTSPEYERNWLGTPAALENLVRWTVLEDQAAEVSEKLKTLAERKDVDQSALHDLFIQRIDHVLENALKDVTVERMYSEHFGDDKSTVKKENVHLTRFLDGQFKGKWSSYTKYNKIFYYWEKINRGYGTKCYWKDEVGHGAMKSPALVIDIENYWELLLILGLNDRKALPPYYQNYRSRNFVAYTGNSILDNTHPYALIEDPCSEENSNGIRFYVYMCKKCVAGIKAEYAKKQNTATSKS
ncbi:MAG TPA: hypothetical protein VEA58_03225, partial [Anaerovoracaceae bacterium]|nr:hypothetical protein [Anaerovoracaceae bacterium]